MNNRIVIGIVVVAVVLGGVYILTRQGNNKMMENKAHQNDAARMESKDDAMPAKDTVMEDKDKMVEKDAAMMESGQYIKYDDSKLAFAKTGKVVLFFNATWCPNCKAIDADIKASLSNIPKDVLIMSVDYDTAKDLKTKYGVTMQHTFVQVDAEGNSLGKWIGGDTLEALLERVR